jgi:cysteine desulfurase/selenocysteine lyase
VKLVAITHLSNALGTINDVTRMTKMAHDAGVVIVIDGAQWVAHFPTDVQAMGCDFYCFSGHKLFAGQALACCTASERCSKRCRHSTAAGT